MTSRAAEGEARGFVFGAVFGWVSAVGFAVATDRPVVGGLVIFAAAALGFSWNRWVKGSDL